MEREAGGRPWGAVRNLQDAPPAVFISLLVSVPHPRMKGCSHKSEAVIVYKGGVKYCFENLFSSNVFYAFEDEDGKGGTIMS